MASKSVHSLFSILVPENCIFGGKFLPFASIGNGLKNNGLKNMAAVVLKRGTKSRLSKCYYSVTAQRISIL
jgi:hypothetical protein